MSQKDLRDSEEETRLFLISIPIFDNFNVTELSLLAQHTSYIHLTPHKGIAAKLREQQAVILRINGATKQPDQSISSAPEPHNGILFV